MTYFGIHSVSCLSWVLDHEIEQQTVCICKRTLNIFPNDGGLKKSCAKIYIIITNTIGFYRWIVQCLVEVAYYKAQHDIHNTNGLFLTT